MSWTEDRAKARWFARRNVLFGFGGAVYQVEVPPGHVLARLADERPGEAEVVVDPTGLGNIVFLERVPSSTDRPAGTATAHISTS